MKRSTTNSKWLLALVLTLLFQIQIFADDIGDFGGGDNPTDVTAPIDSYIWVMMGIGIVFVFFKYRAIQNQN